MAEMGWTWIGRTPGEAEVVLRSEAEDRLARVVSLLDSLWADIGPLAVSTNETATEIQTVLDEWEGRVPDGR